MNKLPNNRFKIKDLPARLATQSVAGGRFKKISFLMLFLLLTSYVLLLTRVYSQETVRTITITPPTAAVKLDAGKTTEGQMKIINDSPNPITFSVNVQDYIVVDTLGTPNILPPNTLNNKYSAASWIAVSPSSFTVNPGKRQVINYYVQIPSYAKPGGHYAAAIFTPKSEGGGGSGAVVTGQIGTLFYVTVNGPITENATVTKFFTDKFHEYGPIKILTQIKNMSDLHITPKGTLTVSGLFLNKSVELPTHNIFPETARDFENSVGSKLMIGRYKAVLLASYGVTNNLPLSATVYFWVFPWRLFIIIVLLVIAVILGRKYYQKRKKEQEHKDNKEEHKEEAAKDDPESPKVG